MSMSQGASNRRVAATNMNRESSRSHSVFTCVIESKWEKDSATNFRFARLNLVDLAGSERYQVFFLTECWWSNEFWLKTVYHFNVAIPNRQKSSGAEGERLKEAASINKSLSTLGYYTVFEHVKIGYFCFFSSSFCFDMDEYSSCFSAT